MGINNSGIPNVTSAIGTLPLLNGGTGATTQSAAANAILPSQSGQAGNFLTTNATNASWAAFVAPTYQIFTSGSGTYTPPSSPRAPIYLKVRIVGGGGGGGGTTGGSSASAAAGGGAGGYVEHIMAPASTAYSVGGSGAGGTGTQGNGVSGGTTTFGSLTAYGGSLAAGDVAGRSGVTICQPGGVGGSASGGNIANIPGQQGVTSYVLSASQASAGAGGSNPMGGGGAGGFGGSQSNAGSNGTGYGGGGGGGVVTSSGTFQNGGSGSHGVVIVEEFYQ